MVARGEGGAHGKGVGHRQTLEEMKAAFDQIPSNQVRAYMDSAMICARLTKEGKFRAQTALCDDVLTVTGHPGTTMREWLGKTLLGEQGLA